MPWSSFKGYLTIKNNQKKIKTCVEFSEKFITPLKGLVNGYEEVRIVFDNYHEVSLKNGRGKASHSRQFVIEDRTIIGMGLKEFISEIKTKHDIIIYLYRVSVIWKYRCTIESQPRRG